MIYFGNSVCCESEISVLCRGGELKIEVNKITAKIKAIAKKAISKTFDFIFILSAPLLGLFFPEKMKIIAFV